MGKVAKEEIMQWIHEMVPLHQEYVVMAKRITKVWEEGKGFSDYREVLAEWELPSLLEKLNKIPLPKDELCEAMKKDCEQTLNTFIEARAIDANHVWESDRPWLSKMNTTIAMTPSPFHFLSDCTKILANKYQL
ncbi:hypothetical protein ACFLRP_00225 [Bacteroidota bacterium]